MYSNPIKPAPLKKQKVEARHYIYAGYHVVKEGYMWRALGLRKEEYVFPTRVLFATLAQAIYYIDSCRLNLWQIVYHLEREKYEKFLTNK